MRRPSGKIYSYAVIVSRDGLYVTKSKHKPCVAVSKQTESFRIVRRPICSARGLPVHEPTSRAAILNAITSRLTNRSWRDRLVTQRTLRSNPESRLVSGFNRAKCTPCARLHHGSALRSRKAVAMTLAELRLIAVVAATGDSGIPKIG
jgi:hypothetical protein